MKAYVVLVLMAALLLSSGFALAARAGDSSYSISPRANSYVAANKVMVNESVDGDLYAMGGNVYIDAPVGQDLGVIGGNVFIDKPVGDTARIISGLAVVDTPVFGDLLLIGGEVRLTNNSQVGGNAMINGGTVWFDGVAENDINVSASRVFINGVVKGNAYIDAPEVFFGSDALVKGDLYVRPSVKVKDTQVLGTVNHIPEQAKGQVSVWRTLVSRAFFAAMLIITGLVLLVFARTFTDKTKQRISTKLGFSTLLGFAMLIVIPIIAVLLLFTIILIPVAMLLLIFYGLAIGLSLVFGAFLTGKVFFKLVLDKEASVGSELVFGSIVFALLTLIPIVNVLLGLFFVLVGLGAASNILIFRKLQSKEKRQTLRPPRRPARRRRR